MADPSDADMATFDDLPEFANEENRALHRQLKEAEKATVVVETELNETKERIGTMHEHLTSVNTEQLHTQRLVDAKIKEIETEDHLKQLAERGARRDVADLLTPPSAANLVAALAAAKIDNKLGAQNDSE